MKMNTPISRKSSLASSRCFLQPCTAPFYSHREEAHNVKPLLVRPPPCVAYEETMAGKSGRERDRHDARVASAAV